MFSDETKISLKQHSALIEYDTIIKKPIDLHFSNKETSGSILLKKSIADLLNLNTNVTEEVKLYIF